MIFKPLNRLFPHLMIIAFIGSSLLITEEVSADPLVEVKADLEVSGNAAIGDSVDSAIGLRVEDSDSAVAAESSATSGTKWGVWAKGPIGIQGNSSDTSNGWSGAFVDRGVLVGQTGSPSITALGGEGDMFIRDDVEIDGELRVGNTGLRVHQSLNAVSIGTADFLEHLTINAVAAFEAGSAPGNDTDYAKLYAKDSGGVDLYAMDEDGNETPLTSHFDPRDYDPDADTVFADPNVVLPFSFRHSNGFIGKGAVVDLASVVAEVERMAGRSFTVVYDLPSEEMRDFSTWSQEQIEKVEERAKLRILEETPELEISIEDAWEEVPVVEVVETTDQVTNYTYDLDTLTVSPIAIDQTVFAEVPTGQTTRQLKDGVRFDEETGRFYRRLTLNDIEVDPIQPRPLPQWIADRLPSP